MTRTHQNIRNHAIGYITPQEAHGVFKANEKKEKYMEAADPKPLHAWTLIFKDPALEQAYLAVIYITSRVPGG